MTTTPAFMCVAPRVTPSLARFTAPSRSSFSGTVVAPATRARRAVIAPRMAISPEVARAAMAVYGVVVAGGGVGAFLKSGSKMSAISGVSAGLVLAAAYVYQNVPVALGTAAVLALVFGVRLAKTKKFMPSGMLLALSVLAAVFFAVSVYA